MTEADTYVGKPKRVWTPGPVYTVRPLRQMQRLYGMLPSEERHRFRTRTMHDVKRMPRPEIEAELARMERVARYANYE